MTEIEKFIKECHENAIWPFRFEKEHGIGAAYSFATGIFELYSQTIDALDTLENESKTMLQDTEAALKTTLPQCFLSRYDLDFVKKFYERVGWWLENGDKLEYGCAHAVIDEIILRIAQDIGYGFVEERLEAIPELKEIIEPPYDEEKDEFPDGVDVLDYWSWAFDLLDDMDVEFLWENKEYVDYPVIVAEGTSYHFDHWFKPQFYLHRS